MGRRWTTRRGRGGRRTREDGRTLRTEDRDRPVNGRLAQSSLLSPLCSPLPSPLSSSLDLPPTQQHEGDRLFPHPSPLLSLHILVTLLLPSSVTHFSPLFAHIPSSVPFRCCAHIGHRCLSLRLSAVTFSSAEEQHVKSSDAARPSPAEPSPSLAPLCLCSPSGASLLLRLPSLPLPSSPSPSALVPLLLPLFPSRPLPPPSCR